MTIYQFLMLRHIQQRQFVTVDACLLFKQRTFGSLCKKDLIGYSWKRDSFFCTTQGDRALENHGTFTHSEPSKKLSIFAPKRLRRVA